MKIKKLSIIFAILAFDKVLSQCPISFPKAIDICLEGNNNTKNICFKNNDGDLHFLLGSKDLFSFSKEGIFKMGDIQRDTGELIITGKQTFNNLVNTNPPNYYRDITYEFADAGKAKIRSFRGTYMDTYLQFLTNKIDVNPNNPQVRMHINHDGKIGIGTIDPQALLDVKGNLKIGDINNNTNNELIITGKQTPNSLVNSLVSYSDITYTFSDSGTSKIRSFRGDYMGTYMQFLTNGNNSSPNAPEVRMHISENGKIGIGTTDPKTLLDIRGNVLMSDSNNLPTSFPSGYRLYVTDGILSEKFKAALKSSSQWADHVFSNDYKLRPLEEVEEYILTNKHLPEIPSANEIVKEGGLDLAQMQAKQMEKIEELTLYLIEMKKEIEALKKENTEMRETIKNKQR